MELLDSRRLTGPNLLLAGPGAALEVALDAQEAEGLLTAWQEHVVALCAHLGWHAPAPRIRRFPGGASLGFEAPIDGLYAACEVNEWALLAAARSCAGQIVDVECEAAPLAALVAEEANPALLALRDAAVAHGLSFLSDDDEASVGTGTGSRTWPVGALPAPDSVAWDALHDVPILLVTGTNGKSTTVRLCAALVAAAGRTPGVSSTDWVRVGEEILETGDYSGPGGARAVLRDRRTEVAILETARGGMFRRGLGVTHATAAAVLNVAEDHLGEWGVGDLQGLVEGKFLVAQALGDEGHLILNADEAPVVEHGLRLGRPIFWFGLDPRQPQLAERCRKGGDACFWEDGTLFLQRGDQLEALISEATLPIAMGGRARFNTANALAASALASCAGIPVEAIRDGLEAFESSAEANPGRGNVFEIGGATVIADFAHNPHGLRALLQMAAATTATRWALVLGQAGDRSDAEVRALCAVAAAAAPDLLVIKDMPEHLRGREAGAMVALIEDALLQAGLPAAAIEHAESELAAAERVLAWAQPGDLVLLLLHAQRQAVLERLATLQAAR